MYIKRALYAISTLLLVASAIMYWNINSDSGQDQLQSSGIKVTAADRTSRAKNNPYVIRNGSNAMPEGMDTGGQFNGDKPKFMPKWQQDKLKNMKGEPDLGSSSGDSNQGASGGTSAAPPSASSGGGITPAVSPP